MSYNFLMLSIDGIGHTYPQLPLAQQLVNCGHRVSYICSTRFKKAVENTGSTWIKSDPIYLDANWTDLNADQATLFSYRLIDNAHTDLETYYKTLTNQKFDAIAYDTFSLAGPILGKINNILQIQLWNSVVVPLNQSSLTTTLKDGERLHTEITNKFFAEYSITNYQPASTLSEQNLAFFPQFFQLGGESYPDNFHFIGPCIGQRLDDNAWTPPQDSRPLIYISLGTVSNDNAEFFRNCIKALADEKYQVVISLGNKVTLADLPDIPDNFTIAPSFPQSKILKHADIFLSHAGMNSTMEGLYYEVPFVLYPQQPEQKYNAQQLITIGVGQLLSPHCTAKEIRQKITEALENPQYRKNSAIYGPKVRNSGGAKKGADIIVNTVHNGKKQHA